MALALGRGDGPYWLMVMTILVILVLGQCHAQLRGPHLLLESP